MAISASQTLREAAATHLAAMKDAGVDADAQARWVRIWIGPIPFAYPNTRQRKRLVLAHDLHHLLTGYGADLVGEAELGAWELGTGVRDRSAVRYEIRVLGFMLPRFPSRLRAAFVRGRHCRNLVGYRLDDAALSRTVADLRTELGLDRPMPEATIEDLREWRRWAAKAIAVVWGPIVPLAALAGWWLR
jgi:ubiquinone biosynthesis protein Coq4